MGLEYMVEVGHPLGCRGQKKSWSDDLLIYSNLI